MSDTTSIRKLRQRLIEDSLASIQEGNQLISSQIREIRQQLHGIEAQLDLIKTTQDEDRKMTVRERAIRELEEQIYVKAALLEQERIELNQLREELDRQHFQTESA